MKLSSRIKYYITETICLLYILLFIYASASKLMDFEHFRIQLGQSPLLSAFAYLVAVSVPAVEILISILLIIPRYRLAGLFAAYGLMVMFTAYIFIILNFSSFVPCSCGGVLEKLSWSQHIIFNLFFIVLAATGLVLHYKNLLSSGTVLNKRKLKFLFFGATFGAVTAVVLLFLGSENIIRYHNKLTRRFPHSPLKQEAVLDLKINSFYIAGADSSHVYLGNVTTPLTVTTLNKKLVKTQYSMINLDRKDLPFQGVRISVSAPIFFVTDGLVPCVYKGNINDWKAELAYKGGEYFTTALAVDSSLIAVVTNSKKTGDNILGIIQTSDKKKTILNPDILRKQFDGVFDTDGQLLYSEGMQRIIYIYAYRNQFTIADKKLNIIRRGNTIDTITKAKLNISKDKKYNERKFSKPPLFVNKRSAVCQNLLFVNSAVPGQYEDDRMWKRTSIIDVYDLERKSYLLSFTINNVEDKKLKHFVVKNDFLYAMIGNHIICYKIDSQITSRYIKSN
ncbi:hypothetical protein D3C87_1064250 [compost metagenome]